MKPRPQRSILCLALTLSLGSLALAKPLCPTTIEEGCANAPIVVIAELAMHQFESIPDGGSIDCDSQTTWSDYKIREQLFSANGSTNLLGKTLRIRDKAYFGCIPVDTSIHVTRKGDTITIERKIDPKFKTESLTARRDHINGPVILFLNPVEDAAGSFSHFGVLLSPQPYGDELRAKVPGLIEKRKAGS